MFAHAAPARHANGPGEEEFEVAHNCLPQSPREPGGPGRAPLGPAAQGRARVPCRRLAIGEHPLERGDVELVLGAEEVAGGAT